MLGEHTDWAAGYRDRNRAIPPGFTIVATTREGLHARVKPRADGRLVFKAACLNPPTSSCGSGDAAGGQEAADAGSEGGATLDVAMTEEVKWVRARA